jgi:hypothetical protein
MEIAASSEPSGTIIGRSWHRIREAERGRREGRDGLGRALKEAWAVLTSGGLVPSHAVRGSTTASPRLLVFETDDYAISISLLEKDSDNLVLLGKVIPRTGTEVPPGIAWLAAGGEEREASIETLGQFRFADVPRGALNLRIQIDDALIHIPPLERSE